MIWRIAAALMLAGFLSGCAERVLSRVTTFHQIDLAVASGKRIAVLPFHADKQPSLEFATYRNKIAERFRQKGLIVVENAAQADWLAMVDYGIDDGVTRTQIVHSPHYSHFGYGHFGHRHFGRGYCGYDPFDYGYYHPFYGFGGYTTNTIRTTTFTRYLAIEIVDRASADRKTPQHVYEGKAVSRGSCGSLPAVFDALNQALLQDWPGVNGKSETVVVPLEGSC